jgi:UDP-glucose 4-epimerase
MTNTSKLLVTGGAGYIGSHACVELLQAGFEITIVDNLCNSSREALRRVESITGKKLLFHETDVRDTTTLARILEILKPQAVLHFAGLKAVGESFEKPLEYYDNNVGGILSLVLAMRNSGVRKIVFSSSATVYGDPATVPISEDIPLSTTNPYGRSKLIIEDMLRDLARSDTTWKVALLRYFNPVGAHESDLIGEGPNGVPSNLILFTSQVAVGRRPHLQVFGGDYPAIDNDRAENAIRPFVIGRKNWLFSDSVRGVKASANLYSLFETAKTNGGNRMRIPGGCSLNCLGLKRSRPLRSCCLVTSAGIRSALVEQVRC